LFKRRKTFSVTGLLSKKKIFFSGIAIKTMKNNSLKNLIALDTNEVKEMGRYDEGRSMSKSWSLGMR
jgi:hypothetical protein